MFRHVGDLRAQFRIGGQLVQIDAVNTAASRTIIPSGAWPSARAISQATRSAIAQSGAFRIQQIGDPVDDLKLTAEDSTSG